MSKKANITAHMDALVKGAWAAGLKVPKDEAKAKALAKPKVVLFVDKSSKDWSGFDLDGALKSWAAELGQEIKADAEEGKGKGKKMAKKESKKRKKAEKGEEDEGEEGSPKKKKKQKKAAKPKSPTLTDRWKAGPNSGICEMFDELRKEAFKAEQRNPAFAYTKVLKALAEFQEEITEDKDCLKRVLALKGVGKSSVAKIKEFFKTGSCEKLEKYRSGDL